MKKLHLTGVLLLLLFSVNPISAQQSQKQPNEKRLLLKRDNSNKRPNSPSRFSIWCSYGDGSLELCLLKMKPYGRGMYQFLTPKLRFPTFMETTFWSVRIHTDMCIPGFWSFSKTANLSFFNIFNYKRHEKETVRSAKYL